MGNVVWTPHVLARVEHSVRETVDVERVLRTTSSMQFELYKW